VKSKLPQVVVVAPRAYYLIVLGARRSVCSQATVEVG
jgi:hypothetical protein